MSLLNATVSHNEAGARVNALLPAYRMDRDQPRPIIHARSVAAANPVVIELIRRHPVLGTLTEQERHTLLSVAKLRSVKRRHPIWHQDANANTVILVLEGYVKAWAPFANGGEAMLEILGPGECAGEISVLHEMPRECNLTALSCCHLVVVQAWQFRQIFHRQPDALSAIIRMTAERLRQAREQSLDSRALTVRARLAKALLYLTRLPSSGVHDPACLPVRLSQSELGAMAGMCREIVNKCLGEWRDAGWLEMSGGTVISIDVDAISEIPLRGTIDDADMSWGARRSPPPTLRLAMNYAR
jgi:CRP/FNR family cyclic AMP-dependent transcriptional regulator